MQERISAQTVLVQQKSCLKVDLREEGIPEDVISKDEEEMKQTNETVEKLKDGSKSVRADLTIWWYDIHRRIKSRDSRDGKRRIVRTGTNFDDCSVSFLPKARARRIKYSVDVGFVYDQLKTQ